MKQGLQLVLTVVVTVLPALGGVGCRTTRAPRVPPATPAAASTVADSASTIYSAAKLPIPELGYNARQGRVLYRHYCLNCHGDAGEGDGFNAYNLDPRPRSLADSTFQAQHSDADLATAIRSGGGAVGLSTGMPPWGRTLNGREIQNLIAYVRTLTDAEPGKP